MRDMSNKSAKKVRASVISRPARFGVLDRVGAAYSALTATPADPGSPAYKTSLAAAKKNAAQVVGNYKFMRDKVAARQQSMDKYVQGAIKAINASTNVNDVQHFIEQLEIAVRAMSTILSSVKTPFARSGAKVTASRAEEVYRKLNTWVMPSNAAAIERLAAEAVRLPNFTPQGYTASLHQLAVEQKKAVRQLLAASTQADTKQAEALYDKLNVFVTPRNADELARLATQALGMEDFKPRGYALSLHRVALQVQKDVIKAKASIKFKGGDVVVVPYRGQQVQGKIVGHDPVYGNYVVSIDGGKNIKVAEKDVRKASMSRRGAKARFAAEWMQHVSNMLRDLTNERQRVQVWIAGPTTIKVAGMWMAYNRYGKGAAIASRMAYYLTQAAGTPGKYSGQDIKDSPRKGTNTTIWTVSNVPEDAVSYLKAWGIGTSPKAFAGFTGESAVAYARPGAKEEMAYGVADAAPKFTKGETVADAVHPNRKGKVVEVIPGSYDAKSYTKAENQYIVSFMPKGGLVRYGEQRLVRASRPGAKAKNALYMIEIVEGGRVTSTITPDQFRDFAVKNVPGVSRNDFVPTMMEKWNDYAEEHGFGARVRIGGKSKNALSDACWSGYEAVGTKQKDGKTVPNCVPKANAAKPSDLEREDVKAGLKLMEKADKAVSDKIRTLIAEGKPQDQAVAIALDMKRRGEL